MAKLARSRSERNEAEGFPIALQKVLPGPVSSSPFDYTLEQWSKIVSAIRPLHPTSDALDEIRCRLTQAAISFMYQELTRPERRERERRVLRLWRDVEAHARRLISEFERLQHEDEGFPQSQTFFEDQSRSLFDARVRANSRIVERTGKIDDGFPKLTPKSLYHSVVLEEWVALGGQLRFSRHPVTGKIKGPLARYFSAVTEPVHGGSPESLPDIIRRHVGIKSAITRWAICMSTMGFSTATVRRGLALANQKCPE